jgi:hypothetical protein
MQHAADLTPEIITKKSSNSQKGEHDPEQLCDQPLASLRQPPLNV